MPIIVSKPHILKQTTYKTIVDTGTYLSEIVDGLDTTSLYIELNGTPIKNGEIPFIKLEENDIVTIINVPQAAAIPTIIVTLTQIGTYMAATTLGWGTLATALAVTAVTIGTALLVNALIPPQQLDKGDTTPTVVKPGITGAQNRYAVWNPIPRLYGTYKYYPPLAARYFTEIAGGDQYLRMLLCLGYGPLEIGGKTASRSSKLTHESGISSGAIKIGDTDILLYDDVEFEIGTIDQISLFTSNIYEENVSVNLDCQSTSGEGGWFTDDVSATRNTDNNTKEISIDLVFPSGLYTMSKKGKIRTAQVDFKVTITDVDSGDLIIEDDFTISGRRKETYRVNKRYVPGYEGQFSVKVTRERTYIQDREVVVTDCVWTALRSIKSEQPVIDNGKEIIYMALRIKATDQLSGIIDQLNVIATSILPVYNGSTWSNQATNNPAWCYYNQLTGEHVKNPISESEILLDDFVEWATFCDNLGLEFNYVFDTEQTQLERLRNIATTGRATPAYRDGYFTIVWDRDSSSETPAQVISPRNSRNFSSTKAFQNLPHALRVRYIDKNNDYTEDEVIVYRDDYNSSTATRYEKLDTLGVTTQQQAWKEGKYHFNQLILRPETFNVEMDFENLAFTRGDVVLLAYDIIEVGIKWGRIKNIITDSSGNISSIILDEACPMETGKTYGIQIRTQNGAILSTTVTNQGDGEFYELYPENTITGCNIGDLVLFGEYGKESIRCKVLSVDYDYDLSARITLIPEAPNVNDTGTTPAYDPHITLPLEFTQIKPPTPSVQAFSGTNTLMLAADGSYQPTVVVTWVIPSTSRVALERIEIRWKSTDDSEDSWHTISAEYSNTALRIFGVQEETTIAIQARVKSVYGRYSDWSEEITHVVAGNTLTPKDVTNFSAEWHPENQLVLFTWDEISDINLDHFEIREGTDWDSGTPVLQNITDFQASLFIPEVTNTTKTYWIKAISKNGTESVSAVSTTVDIYFPKPSAATNITTTSLNYAIKVKVDYTKETYFDKLEIWASENNDRNDAVLVASIEGDEYILEGLSLVDSRYFWVRQRNIFGIYSDWYPTGQYDGVFGETDSSPDSLLPLLQGSITENELDDELVNKINSSAIPPFDSNSTYNKYDICSYNGSVYQAIQDITTTPAPEPTDTSYWQEVGYITSVISQNSSNIATAEESITTLQTDMGEVKSEWTVKLNADGNIAGIGLITSSDNPSEMVVVTDIFKIVNPSDSNDIKVPFVVGDINGQSTVGINGDLIVDGSISARHIGTNLLITDSANIDNGVITNAHIKDYIQSTNYNSSTHTGWKIDKSGTAEFSGITIYDANGNVILASGSGVEWDKIIGTGKPEDNATVGATWNNNITNQPQELLNLVVKPNFEDGNIGLWNYTVYTETFPYVEDVTGQPFSKAIAWGARGLYLTDYFTVHPGETFVLEAYLDASTANYQVGFGVHFIDKTGATVSWELGPSIPAGQGWIKVTGTVTTPSDAVKGRAWLQMDGFDTFGIARASLLRIFRFESGATVGAQAGVNLKDSSGSSLTDSDIITSQGTSADTSAVDTIDSSLVRQSIGANFRNGFEGAEYDQWTAASGNTITKSTDAYSGNYAALMTSTATSPASSGYTGGVYIAIPEQIALAFGGKRIRVTVYAKQPDSNASNEFAVAYSTNDVGNSGWYKFTPTTSWKPYIFYYDVPEPSSGGTDFLGIWADTSGSGLGILIDNVTIELVQSESELDALQLQNAPAEAGATVGAQANVNLKDANGNLASDIIHPGNKITSSNISTYIASAAIGSAYIADAAITNAKIANGAIDSAKIANAAITNAKIADAAITSAKIANAAIQNAHIADLSVNNAKIANLTIGTEKIANGAISNLVFTSDSSDRTFNSGSVVTLDSLSITTTGGKLKIDCTVNIENTTGFSTCKNVVYLYRGTTQLASLIVNFQTNGDTKTVPFMVQDSPSAGTYTYSIRAVGTDGLTNYNRTVHHTSISIMELKK